MAFTFAAFCYMLALLLTAALIFFAIWHIIAFDELKTDYKNPIDQCNTLNPLVLPEYLIHAFFCVMFPLCCRVVNARIKHATLGVPHLEVMYNNYDLPLMSDNPTTEYDACFCGGCGKSIAL
ncbi:unnamed protein product [Ranitomeya imitator]|uniref:Uncharacterized protein n=1 Tax=Ranitomeya imitator TaxID=111125 RepID=A0ABN9LGK4_9NEOB|nr:unnamed protein product [Ranitomeya imitator]